MREKTGATPPLLPLMRLVEGGGATARATARATAPSLDKGGSLPSVRIPAGRLTRPPEARADAPERGAMLDRLLRLFVVIGGVSCVACVHVAGTVPRRRSVGGPGPLPHAHVLSSRRRLVLRRAGRGRLSGRDAGRQYLPDLVRPRGRPARAPQPPSRLAAVADVRRSRPSSSARCITPSTWWRVRPRTGSSSRSGASIPAWRFSGPSGPGRPPRACTPSRASC